MTSKSMVLSLRGDGSHLVLKKANSNRSNNNNSINNTSTYNMNNMNNNNKKRDKPAVKITKKQKWRCDICQVKLFDDLDACKAHEAVCGQAVPTTTTTTRPTTANETARVVDSDDPTHTTTTTLSQETPRVHVAAKRPRTECQEEDDVEIVAVKKASKQEEHLDSQPKHPSTRKAPAAAAASSVIHPFFTGGAPKSWPSQAALPKPPAAAARRDQASDQRRIRPPTKWSKQGTGKKTKTRRPSGDHEDEDDDNDDDDDDSVEVIKTFLPKGNQKAATTATAKASINDENSLHAFWGLTGASSTTTTTTSSSSLSWLSAQEEWKALQADQKVAEFQIQRRRQQELERQRRLKRQQTRQPQQHQQQQQVEETVTVNNTKETGPVSSSCWQSSTTTSHSSQDGTHGYIPFPVPSHVTASATTATMTPTAGNAPTNASQSRECPSETYWWNPSQAARIQDAWQQHVPWDTTTTTTTNPSSTDSKKDDPDPSFVWNSSRQYDEPLIQPCDLLHQSLSALFVPSATATTEEGDIHMSKDDDDDDDEEEEAEDIMSSTPAGRQLAEFLEQWKDIRKEFHRRMTQRNLKLAGGRRREGYRARGQPCGRQGRNYKRSYEEEDEEDYFFSGSDTDEEECMTSLFLLTGPVGTGKTSLVYHVAKQAHCAVLEVNTTDVRGAAALRKRIQEVTQTHSAKWNKKAGIASAFGHKEQPTDDDGTAALTIILLDEVDLLYPENGDNGFWSAVSDVSKKAKAPIIMTANRFPDELLAPSFRYEQAHVQPSWSECAPQILAMAKRQGFSVCPTRPNETVQQDLEHIARMVNGDYRRISKALELLKMTQSVPRPYPNTRIQLLADAKDAQVSLLVSKPMISLQITGIQPAKVPCNQYSLITIYGEGFLSLADPSGYSSQGYVVQVKVGHNDCPHARIMDDTTILAVVCPALAVADLSSSSLLALENFDIKYGAVSLSASRRLGMTSTTTTALHLQQLGDGFLWVSPRPERFLEYDYAPTHPSQSEQGDESEEEEEYEFKDNLSPRSASTATATGMPTNIIADPKAALGILREGVHAWHSRKQQVPKMDDTDDYDYDDDDDEDALGEIDSLCRAASLESDAAFLEDCGLWGIPMLAGGNIPMESNEKSNKLSFQRVPKKKKMDTWICGSNAFMVKPVAREGRLLHRTEQELRGTCCAVRSTVEDDAPADGPVFREDCDDEAFLPFPVPACLKDLPGYIRTVHAKDECRMVPVSVDFTLPAQQKECWERQTQFLRNYVFANHRRDKKLFFRGLNRDMDVLLDTSDSLDLRLVLDYLPLLRGMAIQERAMEHLYKQREEMNGDDYNDGVPAMLLSNNRSLATRSSRRRGREHYFECAMEAVHNLHDSKAAHGIGRALCEDYISYHHRS